MAQPAQPHEVVQRFLYLMEQRELQAAQALLTPDFRMVFPGGVQPASLAELVEWASVRYRFVRKTFDHMDTSSHDGTHAVVYCCGTLHGEWPDGSPFQGIRFIDRFELRDLRIAHQSVWNDMALHLPKRL